MKGVREPALVRFWRFVNKDGPGGCWLWTGWNCQGYGKFTMVADGRNDIWAHQAALLLLRGVDVPKGMHTDHLCRQPLCVNPDHLEVVTPAENTRRALHIRRPWLYTDPPTCQHGHPLVGDNIAVPLDRSGGGSKCRTCRRELNRARRQRFIERHGAERMNAYRRAWIVRRTAKDMGLNVESEASAIEEEAMFA